MPSFYDNLRASRSNTKLPTNNLPTRGDMQKERAAANPPQVSFTDVLRTVGPLAGLFFVEMGKESPEAAVPYVDRRSPEQAQKFAEEAERKLEQADRGNLFSENIVENQQSAEKGTLYQTRDIEPYMSQDILDNYDNLNKILDAYDAAQTWIDKRNVVRNAARNFKNMSAPINAWLEELDYQTTMGHYGNTNPKNISDYMRKLNDTVRRLMSPKML